MYLDTEPLTSEASQAKDCIPLNSSAPIPNTSKMAKDCIPLNSSAPIPNTSKMPPHPMGPTNTVAQCPHCQATVKTTIKYTTTTRTHMTAWLCCLTCCCCCIPYCMASTRNTDHYCPLCDRYLGTYQK